MQLNAITRAVRENRHVATVGALVLAAPAVFAQSSSVVDPQQGIDMVTGAIVTVGAVLGAMLLFAAAKRVGKMIVGLFSR